MLCGRRGRHCARLIEQRLLLLGVVPYSRSSHSIQSAHCICHTYNLATSAQSLEPDNPCQPWIAQSNNAELKKCAGVCRFVTGPLCSTKHCCSAMQGAETQLLRKNQIKSIAPAVGGFAQGWATTVLPRTCPHPCHAKTVPHSSHRGQCFWLCRTPGRRCPCLCQLPCVRSSVSTNTLQTAPSSRPPALTAGPAAAAGMCVPVRTPSLGHSQKPEFLSLHCAHQKHESPSLQSRYAPLERQ